MSRGFYREENIPVQTCGRRVRRGAQEDQLNVDNPRRESRMGLAMKEFSLT